MVHFFVISTIVCVLGLALPPFFGVRTVIMDSSDKATKLPVGSVTYAIPVKTEDVAAGTPILVQEDGRSYRYNLVSVNRENNTGTVIDTTTSAQQNITVSVKNWVPKIVVTIPFVGYLLVATESIEGLIILGLVILFLIILYVMAELWKKEPEDEYEDLQGDTRHVKTSKELKMEEKARARKMKEEDNELLYGEKEKKKRAKKEEKIKRKKIRTGGFVDEIEDFSKMYQYGEFAFDDPKSSNFTDKTRIKRLSDSNQSIVYALSDIEKATFEIYKNGSFVNDSVDIYASSDGLTYNKVEKNVVNAGKAASSTEYYLYEVSTKELGDNVNYIKLELKNDEIIYCPMLGKTKIIYNPIENVEVTNVTLDQKELSINVGQSKTLVKKLAPLYADEQLTWSSRDEDIASVDQNGIVTAKKVGSTIIYAKYNDEIYATSVINVLGENMALNKDVSASTETNQWNKNPTGKLVNDGDYDTRWVSKDGTSITKEQITIDLGEVTTVDNVKLYWESARATDFNIEVSTDGSKYDIVEKLRDEDKNKLTNEISFDPVEARYVRMQG